LAEEVNERRMDPRIPHVARRRSVDRARAATTFQHTFSSTLTLPALEECVCHPVSEFRPSSKGHVLQEPEQASFCFINMASPKSLMQRQLGGETFSRHYRMEETIIKTLARRLTLTHELSGHDGCVNTVCWNTDGTRLLSGSDDCDLGLWSQKGALIAKVPTRHTNNIFGASFVPETGDNRLLSCGADGQLCLTDVTKEKSRQMFTADGMLMKLTFIPGEPHCCLTAGQDGTVRHHDTRVKNAATTVVPSCGYPTPTRAKERDLTPCPSLHAIYTGGRSRRPSLRLEHSVLPPPSACLCGG